MKPVEIGNGFLGFFDRADQTDPTYDPPLDAPCPICLEPVSPPLKTISLMWEDRHDGRSYFYRAHKGCYDRDPDQADKAALDYMSGRLQ